MLRDTKGFSLLELLCALAIVTLLSVGIFYSTQKNPLSTKDSQQTLARLLQTARSTAILKNTEARLLLLNNPESPEHLRQLLVIYKDNNFWHATNTSITLPQDISILFNNATQMSFNDDSFNYLSFSNNSIYSKNPSLTLHSSNTPLATLTLTPAGGIIIHEE